MNLHVILHMKGTLIWTFIWTFTWTFTWKVLLSEPSHEPSDEFSHERYFHMNLHMNLQMNLFLHMKVHMKVHVRVHEGWEPSSLWECTAEEYVAMTTKTAPTLRMWGGLLRSRRPDLDRPCPWPQHCQGRVPHPLQRRVWNITKILSLNSQILYRIKFLVGLMVLQSWFCYKSACIGARIDLKPFFPVEWKAFWGEMQMIWHP